jgi:hypothetical protein
VGLVPAGAGFRVCVVRDSTMTRRPGRSDLLSYNVNGIKLEEAAFFELQRELRLQQVRLPDDEGEPSLFFVGRYEDAIGHGHWLVVRYCPVRDWDGKALGGTDPERRHFFEVIVDERLCMRVRRLAGGEAP